MSKCNTYADTWSWIWIFSILKRFVSQQIPSDGIHSELGKGHFSMLTRFLILFLFLSQSLSYSTNWSVPIFKRKTQEAPTEAAQGCDNRGAAGP